MRKRMNIEREKLLAAEAAASLVQDGMSVGLGTGSTVAYLLPALARRRLSLRCVASSVRTAEIARELGLQVEPFERLDRLDLVIDGADQIAPDGWLIKGGGAAHTREKVIAAATDRFVVIADASKVVPAPMRRLGLVTLRDVPRSPDGGIIADYRGPLDDPAALAARLEATPGVVE